MAKASEAKRVKNGVMYRGKLYPGFNKPKRYSGSGKFKKEVLAKKGNEIKVVRYGHSDYRHNYSSEARRDYLRRSAGIRDKSGRLTKDDKFSSNYWSRRDLWNA
tara:strand:- start:19460 stop:19771 length:312 start_codon:yes stop_codon:yes gene_type:complete